MLEAGHVYPYVSAQTDTEHDAKEKSHFHLYIKQIRIQVMVIFFAQNQQKCWQINQLGIFCKVRDVSVILLIPCSCETTSQPLARRVILRQVFFFPPPLPHNEIWIEVVGIVGSCQQIPQLPATIDQSVPYLKHNCANPLARTDINPKPSSQREGITGYKVVGANADTGTKEERCQC